MKHSLTSLALALCSCAALAGPDTAAFYPEGVSGPRALRVKHAALQLDGRLDDALWAEAPIHDAFVQHQPEDRRPARWHTTVQVVVDDDAITFGIRAYDPEPSKIRAPLARRDQVKRDQDFVIVVLDPVGQRRAAQFARVSASGVIADGVFTADDDAEDFSPDFDLQAAAQLLPDGYSVELRWPLAALRYPYAGGAPWRLMVGRSMPREDSVMMLSAPLTHDALSFIAELQPLEGLGDLVETVRERSFLQVRPELSARQLRRSVSEGAADGHSERHREAALGAEIKWRPRADWVIDATLNPDFSQVELDTPQLAGNTRYALFQQEKRPFFLESKDVVGAGQAEDAGAAHSQAAFYSRAITDPDWGLRATWRGVDAEATALSVRDAGGGQVLRAHAYGTRYFEQHGRSQASFVRARQQIGELSLAGLGARRDYGNGRRNSVFGTDFAWRASEQALLRGHLLLSDTTAGFDAQGQAQRQTAERGHRLWLSWRERSADWNHLAHFEHVAPGFANDNGFVSQTGFRRVSLESHRRLGAQSWAPLGEGLRLQAYEFEWQMQAQETRALADAREGVAAGELIERRLHPGLWFSSARNFELWSHLNLDQQRARSAGRLHSPRTLTLGFSVSPAPWLGLLSAELEWGRRLDVEADRLGRGLVWTLEAKMRTPLWKGWWLDFEPHLSGASVRSPQGDASLSELAAQALAVLHFGARDSVRATVQHTRLNRVAEPGLAGSADRERLLALMYQHRQGLRKVYSLGFTQSRQQPGAERETQWFAKLAIDLMD
ncbi:carbohydrate binding family 9 domain-containing protein [Paucibacter sp. APW11]|uniref:Carbohydrate binding family 9 domain-containing protein n=1 Tax=Roseateles aquae TaxID=3077235 RepID=A0ABU3PHD3_9BURK|nr:carbohydrate binding family 9 domain-containing protein [Paucibacter sp. APW11]MDT9001975.1 carbohydrate binding family 9 domain-containing protein [Paucibacter sp. APW11]